MLMYIVCHSEYNIGSIFLWSDSDIEMSEKKSWTWPETLRYLDELNGL